MNGHLVTVWATVCLLLFLLAPGGASESHAPTRLPAAESGSPGAASEEVVVPGEDSAGPGVAAPQTGPFTAQPQTALLPQTVEAWLQERHRVEGRPGGTREWKLQSVEAGP